MTISVVENKDGNMPEVDYTTIHKIGEKAYTKYAVDRCQEMFRETDNRNPTFFKLKLANPQQLQRLAALGELEVIENQLKEVHKFYKVAIKKKSPQSAWRPVFANLEALALYMQAKEDWFDVTGKDGETERAHDAFVAFGAAWVCMTAKLMGLGSFSENSYPSIRTTMNLVFHLGTNFNDKLEKPLCDWPDKLEALWLGMPYQSKKQAEEEAFNKKAFDAGTGKKAKKLLKKEEVDANELKKQRRREKNNIQESENPWDFKVALKKLKGDRKVIGGSAFNMAEMKADERKQFAIARAAA